MSDSEFSRDEMAEVIARAWRIRAISQRKACADLRIDQGQFSRLVNGHFATTKGHVRRLFAYAKIHLSEPSLDTNADYGGLREQLIQQLMNAWDQTTEGALALGRILDAAAQLRQGSKNVIRER